MLKIIDQIEKEGYIIIDNFLDESLFKFINNSIIEHSKWNFDKVTSLPNNYLDYLYPYSPSISLIRDTPQFVNTIFFSGVLRDDILYNIVLGMVHRFQSYFNYEFYVDPIRFKVNFQYPIVDYKKGMFNIPHIDAPTHEGIDDTYITAIYYLNNSNGFTYLFDQMWNGEKYNKLTIFKEIKPKVNRLVLFSTKRIHAGSPPTNNEKILLNLNMQLIKKQ